MCKWELCEARKVPMEPAEEGKTKSSKGYDRIGANQVLLLYVRKSLAERMDYSWQQNFSLRTKSSPRVAAAEMV